MLSPQLLLAVSACERPVTPSTTFSMLPSVTSIIRAADNEASKEILAHAQQGVAGSEKAYEEKMETCASVATEKRKEAHSESFLFELNDSEVTNSTPGVLGRLAIHIFSLLKCLGLE